jgi:DNA-binding transcriptional LysR family regulator
MDHLRTIESFVRVVRNGSFSKAAEELGASRALITRHILDLENRLGVRLMNRTTRQLALTEIGATYFDFCTKMLLELEQAETTVRQLQSKPEGVLRVIAPKSFGGFHFADAVSAFALRHPKIHVVFVLDDEATHTLNFASNDFDVAIRLSPLADDSAAVVRKIGSLEWIVCAAPDYLAQYGTPKRVEDYADANCLLHTRLASDRVWRFGTGKQRINVKVMGNFTSNSVLAIRRAAIAGLGIAQLPTYYISGELKSGKLVRIATQPALPARPVYALLPGNRMTPKKAQLFVSFIARWYKARPWSEAGAADTL